MIIVYDYLSARLRKIHVIFVLFVHNPVGVSVLFACILRL